ncbi:hypothetical protein [Parathalassolituus penaei]|uniref:Uncharacterized protein n=1 Tax=Parathalassolituus penaei TaxID=2997323 RepID=A0A9X3EFJ4_9GAMM|nr:hypothetical protein [Parathalassolituus penaei]MCY0966693.1 hypothetical protein [Parathalassolituus penaei]
MALTILAASPASANDDFDMPMPEVLTPMRLSEPLSETPAAVTVITTDQLRQWGIHEFSDIFTYVPDMFTARSPDSTQPRCLP